MKRYLFLFITAILFSTAICTEVTCSYIDQYEITLDKDWNIGNNDIAVTIQRDYDNWACAESANIKVHVLTPPVLTVIIVGPTFVCNTSTPAYLYAVVDPAGAPVTYQWYEDGVPKGTDFTQVVNNIPRLYPYTYVVEVTDVESGCVIQTVPHSVIVEQLPIIGIIADKTEICAGETVQLVAAISDSDQPYMIYQWYANGIEISGANANTCSHYQTVTTDYTFTATLDGTECVAHSNSVTVTVKSPCSMSISGNVIREDQISVTAGTVELHKANKNGTSYNLVASVPIKANGTYLFDNVEQGIYLIRVKPQDPADGFHTYYESAEHWKDATEITVSNGSVYNLTITLISRPNMSGSSSINGYVYEEPNGKKGISSGKGEHPASDIEVYLQKYETDWKTVLQTLSDINGFFEFKKIPEGKYRVLLDIPGLSMNDIIVIELAEGEEVDDISYIVTDEGIIPMGIADIDALAKILIYPNPTTGELHVTSNEFPVTDVEVFDVYGRKLSSNHLISTSPHHQINISHLSAGIYFLKISTEAGEVIRKVVKE